MLLAMQLLIAVNISAIYHVFPQSFQLNNMVLQWRRQDLRWRGSWEGQWTPSPPHQLWGGAEERCEFS